MFNDTHFDYDHVNDRREQSETMRTKNKRKDENVKIDCPGFDIQSIVIARKAEEPSISRNERRIAHVSISCLTVLTLQ